MQPRSYRLWTQSPILLAKVLHGMWERARGLGHPHTEISSSQSLVHGGQAEGSPVSPLPTAVKPPLATALLKEQHPQPHSSRVCKPLPGPGSLAHPAKFTPFISRGLLSSPSHFLRYRLVLSSSQNTFPLVTNSGEDNNKGYHLLSTYLCKIPC